MAEGRSRGEEISSPQADFATAHQRGQEEERGEEQARLGEIPLYTALLPLPTGAAFELTQCFLLGDVQQKPQKGNYPRGNAENKGGELEKARERFVGLAPGL